MHPETEQQSHETGTLSAEEREKAQKEKEKQKQKEKQERKRRAALRWWIGTVFLTLFPTLTTVLVVVLQEQSALSWDLVFEDGELILASYLIVTSTSISAYTVKKETLFTDVVHYILKFLPWVQLTAYTVVRTNTENNLITLVIVSVSALIVSICCSWIWFVLTNEEV